MRHIVYDEDGQAALALTTPPLYGIDQRGTDVPVFQFIRDDGHGFLVGLPCAGSATCVDIPLGIMRLVSDLRALDKQQLMDPSCAALTN